MNVQNAVKIVEGKNLRPDLEVTQTGSVYRTDNSRYFLLKAGRYTVSYTTTSTANNIRPLFYVQDTNRVQVTSGDVFATGDGIYYDNSWNGWGVHSGMALTQSFTLMNDYYVQIVLANFNSSTSTASDMQVEYGSTATAYEPYQEVRAIHDKDDRLIWGRLEYDTKYAGNVVQQEYSGKNLFHGANNTSYGITYVWNGNSVAYAGTPTDSWNWAFLTVPMNLPVGTYTFSSNEAPTGTRAFTLRLYDASNNFYDYNITAGHTSVTFTTSVVCTGMRLSINGFTTGTYAYGSWAFQLESGQYATAMEPYAGDIGEQTYSGKNLLGPAAWRTVATSAGYPITNATAAAIISSSNNAISFVVPNTYGGAESCFIPVNSGETYTVSFSGTLPNRFFVTQYNSSKTRLSTLNQNTVSQLQTTTVTTTDSGYITVAFANTSSGVFGVSNIQVERGSSATSYEPYVGGIPAPNPNYPQPVTVAKGTQAIKITGKNLFSGSPSQFDNQGGTGSTYGYFKLPSDGLYRMTLKAKTSFTPSVSRYIGFTYSGGTATGGYKWVFAGSTSAVPAGTVYTARNDENTARNVYGFVSVYPADADTKQWFVDNFEILLEHVDNLFTGDQSQFDSQGGEGTSYLYFALPTTEKYSMTLVAKNNIRMDRQRTIGFSAQGGTTTGVNYSWAFQKNAAETISKGAVFSTTNVSGSDTFGFVSTYPKTDDAIEWFNSNFDVRLTIDSPTAYEAYQANDFVVNLMGKNLCTGAVLQDATTLRFNFKKLPSKQFVLSFTSNEALSAASVRMFSTTPAYHNWNIVGNISGVAGGRATGTVTLTDQVYSELQDALSKGAAAYLTVYKSGADFQAPTDPQIETGASPTVYAQHYDYELARLYGYEKNYGVLPDLANYSNSGVDFSFNGGMFTASGTSTWTIAGFNVNLIGAIAYSSNYPNYATINSSNSIEVPAGVYVVSADVVNNGQANGGIYVGVGSLNSAPSSGVKIMSANGKGTIVVTSGQRLYVSGWYEYSGDAKGVNIEVKNIRIYQPSNTSVNDYIYKSGSDWKVHKAINVKQLDGTESWSGSGSVFQSYDAAADKDSQGSAALSNYFTYAYYPTQITSNIKNGEFGWNSTLALTMRNDNITGYSNFKDWLFVNNVTLYYALATPTDTTITDATLIAQLEAIHEWMTRYGYYATVVGDLPIVIDQEEL